MTRSVCGLLATGCLALLIVGCAGVAVAPDATAMPRVTLSAFELEARLSASDGERAANGLMLWTHTRESDEWTFLSPLGQTLAKLISTPSGAILTTADGQRLIADNPADLLPGVLGVSAPVASLPHWVQATPGPTGRVLQLDEMGRPARISDEGWIVDYLEYASASTDAQPRRIEARWGDNRIRLIVDQWIPNP